MLHADLHAGPHLRAFVEGRHATAAGRALPGGRRPLDQDAWDVQNAFVDIACCAATGAVAPVAMATLRVGRQEIALGRERLLSPLDWANARRSFEGARLQARRGSVGVDAFWARPVVVRQSQRNRPDTATRLWGATVQRRGAAPGRVWELYALGLEQDGPVAFAGATGAHRRVHARRAHRAPDPRRANDARDRGGWTGRAPGRQRVRAWFVASEASRAFAGAAQARGHPGRRLRQRRRTERRRGVGARSINSSRGAPHAVHPRPPRLAPREPHWTTSAAVPTDPGPGIS
jgi:hypothetical protein